MNLSDLAGKRVWNAFKSNDDIYLETDKGAFRLYPEGDCCANCFVVSVDNADALRAAEILRVEDLDTSSEEVDWMTTDTFGHRIVTDRGICTIDMRTEHNGYYSGCLNVVAVDCVPNGANPLHDFT